MGCAEREEREEQMEREKRRAKRKERMEKLKRERIFWLPIALLALVIYLLFAYFAGNK